MLCPLAQATVERCGGKAAALAALRARGLPVPDGVCIPTDWYRRQCGRPPLPALSVELGPRELQTRCAPLLERIAHWQPRAEQRAALEAWLGASAGPVIVRSSATCEDAAEFSAAGLFMSLADVFTLEQLLGAVRRVWASLWEPPACGVLLACGRAPAREAMGVLLQPQIAARRAGLALLESGAGGPTIRIEGVAGSAEPLARGEVEPETITIPARGALSASAFDLLGHRLAELRALVLEAAATLHADGLPGDVEVEWIDDGATLWLVQARRVRRRTPAVQEPGAGFALHWSRPADRARRWRWDREHNPEPLSPAHAALIARLARGREHSPYVVQGGYLFHDVTPEAAAPELAGDELEPAWEAALARLRALLDAPGPALEAPAPRLDWALALFVDFCRVYAEELSPPRLRARRRLEAALRAVGAGADDRARAALAAQLSVGHDHDALRRAEALYRVAGAPAGQRARRRGQYLERYGRLTLAWDVAAPTLVERPEVLDGQISALGSAACAPAELHRRQCSEADALLERLATPLERLRADDLRRCVERARAARACNEDDDMLFCQALWVVRSALLDAGAALVERGLLERRDQVFLLDIESTRAALTARAPLPLAAEVERAGRQREAQRRLVPPLAIDHGHPRWPSAGGVGGPLLRGVGIGGVATGRVCLVADSVVLDRDLRGRVLVSATLLPALAVVLPQVAALVTDHGGLLSHAACLARELGVPTVVGTRVATRSLVEGEWVFVDGRTGRVARLE